MWFVEGLGDGRFTIISRTHHCMVDGISGVDIAAVLMDAEARTQPPPPPKEAWKPRPAPSGAELLAETVRDQLGRNPWQFLRGAIEPGSEVRRVAMELAGGIAPLVGLAQMGNAPSSSLNQAIGPHRRFETVGFELAEIKKVRAGRIHRRGRRPLGRELKYVAGHDRRFCPEVRPVGAHHGGLVRDR